MKGDKEYRGKESNSPDRVSLVCCQMRTNHYFSFTAPTYLQVCKAQVKCSLIHIITPFHPSSYFGLLVYNIIFNRQLAEVVCYIQLQILIFCCASFKQSKTCYPFVSHSKKPNILAHIQFTVSLIYYHKVWKVDGLVCVCLCLRKVKKWGWRLQYPAQTEKQL